MAATKKAVPRKAVAKKANKQSSAERLLTLLEDPRYALLAKALEQRGTLADLRNDELSVEFSAPPRKGTKDWSPESEADVLVFEDPCLVKGTFRTDAEVSEANRILIFLGGVHAKNVFVDDDTVTYCFGPCEVDGLFFAAARDSDFLSFTSITATVMYGGHGDSWASVVAGSASFEVIDESVEGKKIVARQRKARAADLLIEDILEDGELDRDLLLDALDTTSDFLRKEPPAATPAAKGKSKAPTARRFELVDGGSSKFWEISVDGASLTTRFGRIGTDGQSSTKAFASAAEASKAYEKLVSEKTKKGYQER